MKKLSLFLVALTMILFSCKPEVENPEDPENPEQPVGPVVITAEVTEIALYSAKCGGEVVSGGDAVVIARGICYNTTGAPTVSDTYTMDGNGMGVYTSYMTDLDQNTTYYVRAYATDVKGITSYGEERTFKTLAAYSPATGTSNGYGYVDLGLSVKWATCNVGASKPEKYGNKYAWGATTKETYNSSNCPTYGLSISQLQSRGYIDSEGNLTSQYDAATANCGGNWRMPTYDELNELIEKCTWELIFTNDVKGYSVTGPSGASIFLPAAGCLDGSSNVAGSCGYYWSSLPHENCYYHAYHLAFSCWVGPIMYYDSRSHGLSVRPVLE